MDLHSDFEAAVDAVSGIDFTNCEMETLIVFETTIRHLGGFLGATMLVGGGYPVLLKKAVEVGEMLYAALIRQIDYRLQDGIGYREGIPHR